MEGSLFSSSCRENSKISGERYPPGFSLSPSGWYFIEIRYRGFIALSNYVGNYVDTYVDINVVKISARVYCIKYMIGNI